MAYFGTHDHGRTGYGLTLRARRAFSLPDSIVAILVLGVLPNLFFLLVMPVYMAQRLISPLLYLAGGTAAFFMPRWASYLAFLAIAALDTSIIVAMGFHLPFGTAFRSLRYMATIDIFASLFYVSVLAVICASACVTAFAFNRTRHILRRASPLPVALFALALCGLDYVCNFRQIDFGTPPFENAMTLSGLEADLVAGSGKNLMVVMVEGLGAFADPQERRVLSGILEGVAVDGRYRLSSGTTSYLGSTTAAAARELCGKWGDYTDLFQGEHGDCLPARLGAAGYRTTAFHGFRAEMFQRDTWYPRIGFQEVHFQEDMERNRPERFQRRCGSVFPGLCDAEVGESVRERLTQPSRSPEFVYWLTLNSHLPYVALKDGPLACGSTKAVIGDRTVCELTELWSLVFEKVAGIAADPALPPTDILVVGDHMTPLWQRSTRRHFLPGKVDWYLLRRSEKPARPTGGRDV